MNMILRSFHHPFFLPHRFVFFADTGAGPEGFRPEEDGKGVTGVSEAAAEAATEERRQAAAGAKRQQGEEKKVKRRDTRLADIMKFFIHGAARDDRMVMLLTKLLQHNAPVSVLLSVLSLNYSDIIPILEDYLEEERELIPDQTPMEEEMKGSSSALVEYGKELAETLGRWSRRVFINASFHPMKTIMALARFHGVDSHMTELTTLMIDRYFKESGQDIEHGRVEQFSDLFWKDTLKRLHRLAGERGLLPEPGKDPMQGDDDE